MPAILTMSPGRPSRMNSCSLTTSMQSGSFSSPSRCPPATQASSAFCHTRTPSHARHRVSLRGPAQRHRAGFGAAVDFVHRDAPPALPPPAPAPRAGAWWRRACRRAPERRRSRRWQRATGAASSRASARGGSSASAAAMSAGSSGRAECTAMPFCSGSMTVVSSPYMCCGGTVPSMAQRAARAEISEAARQPARRRDERSPALGVRLGPAGAAGREHDHRHLVGGDAGHVEAAAGGRRPRRNDHRRQPRGQLVVVREAAACRDGSQRSRARRRRPGSAAAGSSARRSSAAAKPSMKFRRSSHRLSTWRLRGKPCRRARARPRRSARR